YNGGRIVGHRPPQTAGGPTIKIPSSPRVRVSPIHAPGVCLVLFVVAVDVQAAAACGHCWSISPPVSRAWTLARHLFDGMPPKKRGKKDKGAAAAETLQEVSHDHIGALPDDALHHILSFLPAQDVVRTCVLAQRWRHLWKSTRALRIISPGSIAEIKMFVDHLLLLRAGSPIDKFELHTCKGLSKDDIHVILWVRSVVACKAQAIELDIFQSFHNWLELDDLHLVFASQHLTRLEFAYVAFNDSILNFSRCTALQDLHIRMCYFQAKRISSHSLKRLSFTECRSSDRIRTRIHTPNLISLCLDKAFPRAPVLETMPSLSEAVVAIHDGCADLCNVLCENFSCAACYGLEEKDTSCVLLQGLSSAENLTLTAQSQMFIFRRDLKWFPTFRNLKKLLLNEHWSVPDLSALSCILEHSPVLEKLTLQLFSKGPKHNVHIKGSPDPKETPAARLQHLKIVEVKCKLVDENVLNVLKFLDKWN
ncbi:hypothetical protein EJB05_50570, partial [Eragrostis curvula]